MSGKPKHGLSYTPEYRAWQTMRLRCLVPSNPAYKDYGGRGITVCSEWQDSPEQFVTDMGPKPSPSHELDRIDNNGPYSPENCRWVPRTINCRNRRSNRMIILNGENKSVAEWCEQLGIPRDTAHKRLEAGWTAEQTFYTPVRPKAAKGKRSMELHCIECETAITKGQRCKSCENKRRWRERDQP